MKQLLAITLMLCALGGIAHARDGWGEPPREHPRMQLREPHQRPMMIPNEMHSDHRRQGAKCMNAYGDDHSGFTDCIRGDADGYDRPRPQFMPMPSYTNDY